MCSRETAPDFAPLIYSRWRPPNLWPSRGHLAESRGQGCTQGTVQTTSGESVVIKTGHRCRARPKWTEKMRWRAPEFLLSFEEGNPLPWDFRKPLLSVQTLLLPHNHLPRCRLNNLSTLCSGGHSTLLLSTLASLGGQGPF